MNTRDNAFNVGRPAEAIHSYPEVQARVSPQEWAVRVELAAAYRLVAHFGMDDLIYNHISVRVPGQDNHFLINPYGLLYTQMTASSLLKIDLDGQLVDPPPHAYGVNRAGFVIHSAVHRSRHDAHCVLHTHTPAGMAVSALECGLLPLTQTAMFFSQIPVHEYEGVAVDLDEQRRIVADLGDHNALILRNHGLLTVGPSIPEAFTTMYWLERACQAQTMAMACNTPLHMPPKEIVEKTNHLYKPTTRRPYGLLEWPALVAMLDAKDPSFRT